MILTTCTEVYYIELKMAQEVCEEVEKIAIEEPMTEDVVDPWSVKASSNKGIDYEKLIGEKICIYKTYIRFC